MSTGYVSLCANAVAIMLTIGVMVLQSKLRMRDELEKKIFSVLLFILIWIAVFYVLAILRDDGYLPCNRMGAMLLETGVEYLLNAFAIQWFIYVEYRMYHSIAHLKVNAVKITAPFAIMMLMEFVNIFTGYMFYFDENLVLHELTPYIFSDIIRTGYFISSLIILTIHKRRDERMKFFSVGPFLIPLLFYVLLFYFTPYATPPLGLAIGVTMIYVELINEQCYMDSQTGFFNRLYLKYLKKRIDEDDYDLQSALIYKLAGDSIETAAPLITSQLPDDCDTIRYGLDTVITLAHVNDRAPMHMLSEDVQMSLEEANISVDVSYELKKKKESGAEFLERVLGKA